MSGLEAKLAHVTAIEQYAKVMKAKGLHARARWALEEARKLTRAIEAKAGVTLPRAA